MPTVLTKTLRFDAAHWLPTFPDGHKCRRLHGHSFRVDLVVEGDVPADRGYLIDFGRVKQVAQPIVDELDHRLLNDVPGLQSPTAENLARWLYDKIKTQLPELTAVRVHETPDNVAEYRPS